ncbi:MAG: 16S rRNA (uracil(1498)-N(3))-methyltransferase, partial [Cyanobacteria bacterium]|nr:16S rRNA (uracil(1498)-N(3))-methyltransferase [Cyanobacteriota bacterium]
DSSCPRRFFLNFPQEILELPSVLTVADEGVVHHWLHVLRLKPGAMVHLVDSRQETLYFAQIESLSKQGCQVTMLSQEVNPSTAPENLFPRVHLGLSLIKENRWDWLLQKATELGVRSITPLTTQRTVVLAKDPDKKNQRWMGIIESAAEQSESLFLPTLHPTTSLKDFCDWVNQDTEIKTPTIQKPEQVSLKKDLLPPRFCLLEREGIFGKRKPLRYALKELGEHPENRKPLQDLYFAIGPEGGWAPEEVALMENQGFQLVSLGDKILRSETAAIALMGALAYEYDTLISSP